MSTIYCQTPVELLSKIRELRKEGYNVKRGENSNNKKGNYFYASISEKVVQRKGKCGFCGELIDSLGIFGHNRKCEKCGKVISLRLKPEDLVIFVFRDDNEFFGKVTLKVFECNEENKRLICYKELPEQERDLIEVSKEKTLQKLEQFKDCYEVIQLEVEGEMKEFYSFFYNIHSFRMEDECKINMCNTKGSDGYGAGYKNCKTVKVYKGKEYSDFDRLPIEESISLYADWKIKKDIKEIVSRSGMSTRPEYYSGRGATLSDLRGKHLVLIYNGIEKYIGEKACKQYVKMIEDIPVMSATDFLKCLYILDRNDWVWDSKFVKKADEKQGRGISFDNMGTALGTLMSLSTGRLFNDATVQIKLEFFKETGIPILKKMKKNMVVDPWGLAEYIMYDDQVEVVKTEEEN